jgi:hypothetical protein
VWSAGPLLAPGPLGHGWEGVALTTSPCPVKWVQSEGRTRGPRGVCVHCWGQESVCQHTHTCKLVWQVRNPGTAAQAVGPISFPLLLRHASEVSMWAAGHSSTPICQFRWESSWSLCLSPISLTPHSVWGQAREASSVVGTGHS